MKMFTIWLFHSNLCILFCSSLLYISIDYLKTLRRQSKEEKLLEGIRRNVESSKLLFDCLIIREWLPQIAATGPRNQSVKIGWPTQMLNCFCKSYSEARRSVTGFLDLKFSHLDFQHGGSRGQVKLGKWPCMTFFLPSNITMIRIMSVSVDISCV